MNIRSLKSRLASLALLLFATTSLFAATAEIELVRSGHGGPLQVRGGEQILFTFGMRNNGPEVARDVTVTLHIPPGLTVTRIHGDDSTCDYNTSPLRCRTTDLQPNGLITNYWEIVATAPHGVTQEMTLSATVASSATDPKPDNNTTSFLFQVGDTPNLHVEAAPGLVRILPDETFVSRVSISNFGHPIAARDITLRLDVQNGTLEKLEAPAGWSCVSDAAGATCTAAALEPNCACSGNFFATVRAHGRTTGGNVVLTARATTPHPEWYLDNNFRTVLAEVYREIRVTSAGDAGPGSLRAAIDEANANCSPGPCRIAFRVPGPPQVITLRSPLPEILASRVFVDGTDGSAALDGHLTSGPGLVFRSQCEAIAEGLSMHGFSDHAIVFSATAPCSRVLLDQRRIANNVLSRNLRGILVDRTFAQIQKNVIRDNFLSGIFTIGAAGVGVYENTIEANGRSGIYLSPETTFAEVFRNTISQNAQMGVAVAAGAQQVDIRENSMRANGGLGIDWNLDGVSPIREDDRLGPSNAPTLFSATYDAARGVTVVTGRLETDPLGPYINAINIDFYLNATPDGDGEQWLMPTGGQPSGTFTAEFRGDHRGKWINATSTRTHWIAVKPPADHMVSNAFAGGQSMTSELSNAVLVQ